MNKQLYKLELKIYNKPQFDWRWWLYLIFSLIFLGFLVGGAYVAMFIDYWYVSPSREHASFFNWEILMSYLSVQVNLITIIWMFILVIKRANTNSLIKTSWFRAVINLNLLMFVIFWAGIILDFATDAGMLSQYATSQIVCTIVTHFICPLFLMIMYISEPNKKIIKLYKTIFSIEYLLVATYLIFYLFYILLRAQIYENITSLPSGFKDYMKWPYDFLNFDYPFMGWSVFKYTIILIFIFFIWSLTNEFIILIGNNIIFLVKKHYALEKKFYNLIK